ncbi:class F sortase [Streptomyces sp. ACA25]|uniref:class F sortase n=1 Tax=Streptomyces sp. ACA25 TaxID=3022596 RepID=UPI002307A60D|nr:class F sortase [Streptomyces sp. ACA25]MDB1089527.1 class F sortase [Streptomyces sp. ACA25]
MEGEPRPSGSGRLVSATAWALLLLFLWLWGRDLTEGGLPGGVPGSASSVQLADGTWLPPAARPLTGEPAPLVLEIDSIGVRADIIERGVDATGGVEPPPFGTPHLVGWYRDGPTPGGTGAAVLVGHVDTETERAVFFPLSTVAEGSTVTVTREDGSAAEFTVENVETVHRRDFDPGRVYGPDTEGRAELRLITCGGVYEPERRAYSANVVVSAYLTGSA